ncbi:MAG: transglutaminase domain-containing protein [Clostridia bacterium]|nr:transglutaminase domain-containing protein [Clostridia bacterium]
MDISNAKNGTIKVKYTGGGSSRIKVQLIKTGTYNYDLNTKGKYEEFPLNMGSGSYTVKVMQNIGGNRYTAVYATSISVTLTTEYAPYLTSSQYVNYDKDTKVISKAKSLCKGKTSDLKKIDAIYDYVIDLLNYDTKKAKTVKSGYLPNLDAIYNSKKGICFDYAAMLAAMLRSQGIPTRLVTGYVGKEGLYHAWNEVYTKETGWVSKVISFDGRRWKLMDPTFASSGNSSKSIMDFIANTSNYRIKYTY